MTARKYKEGQIIRSIYDFDQSESEFNIVHFGNKPKTVHRSFLISQQYRVLKRWIERGMVFAAERIENDRPDKQIGCN